MAEKVNAAPSGELPLEGVGQKLRRTRETKGLSLEDMAKRTRIALRHLEIIERGAFPELPARTYTIGFTRSYARELGLDENEVLSELRAELSDSGAHRNAYAPGFEPGDPAKVPPPAVIWASVIAVLVLAIGVYAFYARFFAPGADPVPNVAEAEVAPPLSLPPSDPATAPEAVSDMVVFTSLEDGVWVSFYEAEGQRLEQKLMAKGERFIVPADARDPRIWTGRPDAFEITIGGEPAPKLAETETVVRDVAITAEALRARSTEPAGRQSLSVSGSASSAVTVTH